MNVQASPAVLEALRSETLTPGLDPYVDARVDVDDAVILHIPKSTNWRDHLQVAVMSAACLCDDVWLAADEVATWPPDLEDLYGDYFVPSDDDPEQNPGAPYWESVPTLGQLVPYRFRAGTDRWLLGDQPGQIGRRLGDRLDEAAAALYVELRRHGSTPEAAREAVLASGTMASRA